MMYLNQLMRSQRLTKAELSRQSGIPETTPVSYTHLTLPTKLEV